MKQVLRTAKQVLRNVGQAGVAARRTVLVFVAGMLATCVVGVWAGGEAVTQVGLRLVAAETRWQWDASPAIALAGANKEGRGKK